MIDAEAEGHRAMKRWAMLEMHLEMQLRVPTMFYQRKHREIWGSWCLPASAGEFTI